MSCIIETIKKNKNNNRGDVNPWLYVANAPQDLKRDEGLKLVDGYKYYGITTHGRVWSYRRKIWLAQYTNYKGYKYVTLSQDGDTKNFRVNRLVALAFIPNPNNCDQVNHRDENKANNHVSNLQWMTAQENINHGTGNARRRAKLGIRVVCFETGEMWDSKNQFRKYKGLNAYEVIDHPSKTYEGKHYFTAPKERTVETSAYVFWNKIEHFGRDEEYFAAAQESAMKVWGFVEEAK